MGERSDTRLGGSRLWLVVQRNDGRRVVEVNGGRFVIGRDPASDLVLEDEKVSRAHAAIRLRPGHKPELEDLGSANGTFVNGVRVHAGPGYGAKEAVTTLGDGDLIQCGDTMMVTSLLPPAERGGAG